MTQALLLSGESRRRIADEAEAAEAVEHKKARKHFRWSIGLFVAGVAVATAFPPAALPGLVSFIALTAGVVTTAYGTGHSTNAQMLAEVKKEAGQDGFADKMKARADKFAKIFRRADKISDRTLYGALALAGAAFLAPVAAPVIWAVYGPLVCVMGAATLVRAVARDPNKSAAAINATRQELGARDTLAAKVPPANDNPPAPPALVADFGKTVNGPAPAVNAEPVKAPTPPKP
jgi:hypothetical protein